MNRMHTIRPSCARGKSQTIDMQTKLFDFFLCTEFIVFLAFLNSVCNKNNDDGGGDGGDSDDDAGDDAGGDDYEDGDVMMVTMVTMVVMVMVMVCVCVCVARSWKTTLKSQLVS